MAKHWSNERIVEALAALEANQGALRRTAREVGVPATTLVVWRDRALAAKSGASDRQERDFGLLWAEAEAKVLELIAQKAPAASFRDLSIFAGIAADKHLDYTIGRRGAAGINVSGDKVLVQVVYDGDGNGDSG